MSVNGLVSPSQTQRLISILILERVKHNNENRVAIILPMNTDSIAAYLGLQWIGAQLVSIPESFCAEEIAKRLKISQAKAVLTVSEYTRGGKKISLGQRFGMRWLVGIAASCPYQYQVQYASSG